MADGLQIAAQTLPNSTNTLTYVSATGGGNLGAIAVKITAVAEYIDESTMVFTFRCKDMGQQRPQKQYKQHNNQSGCGRTQQPTGYPENDNNEQMHWVGKEGNIASNTTINREVKMVSSTYPNARSTRNSPTYFAISLTVEPLHMPVGYLYPHQIQLPPSTLDATLGQPMDNYISSS
eukprot:scaffold40896_cov41-Cyclotella_meneghiniana.AAC.4